MSFVHRAFDHKINTSDNADDGENNGSVDPVLYAVGLFNLFFITRIFFNDGMHPVCHDDEHDEDGGG